MRLTRPLLRLLLVAACCVWSPRLPAQEPEPPAAADEDPRVQESADPQSFWECALDGGSFLVGLGNIVAVSRHEYVVDGAARVYETTVSTNSSLIGRFYFIEAVTDGGSLAIGQEALKRAQALVEEAADRTGADPVWKKVIKNYPTSTHAHTAEYRLTRKGDVDRIYDSVRRCLRTGRGAQLRVRSS